MPRLRPRHARRFQTVKRHGPNGFLAAARSRNVPCGYRRATKFGEIFPGTEKIPSTAKKFPAEGQEAGRTTNRVRGVPERSPRPSNIRTRQLDAWSFLNMNNSSFPEGRQNGDFFIFFHTCGENFPGDYYTQYPHTIFFTHRYIGLTPIKVLLGERGDSQLSKTSNRSKIH